MSDDVIQNDPLSDVYGAVDTKREEEGDWFEHAPVDELTARPNQIDGFQSLLIDANGNGLKRVRVSSTHTVGFRKGMREANMRAMRLPKGKREEFIENARDALAAEHALRDWEFTNRNGDAIPFETKHVNRIMGQGDDPGERNRFRHHKNFVWASILKLQGELEEVAEEDEGN